MPEKHKNKIEYAVIGYVDNDESRPNAEIIREFSSLADALHFVAIARKEPDWSELIANRFSMSNYGDDPQYFHLSRIVKMETIEVLV